MPRNWPPREQGPPSRQYKGAENAANDSAIDSDDQVEPRHIMEFERLLGHASEEITRGTQRMSGVPLTKTWSSCVQCSESRVRRYAVPKSTESRTNERAERFFIDFTGPFHVISFVGNRYMILCVDDPTSFKFIRFLKHETMLQKSFANSSWNASPRRLQDRHRPRRRWRRV